MGSAGPASSRRSAAAAPAGIVRRRCTCARPAASAERLTAAPATGRAAFFSFRPPPPPPPSCRITAQITVSTIAVFPDRVGKRSRNRHSLAAHLSFIASWIAGGISRADP